MPISEMQARVFFHSFDGKIKLPTREVMLKDIQDKREANKKRYVASLRHTIQVSFKQKGILFYRWIMWNLWTNLEI